MKICEITLIRERLLALLIWHSEFEDNKITADTVTNTTDSLNEFGSEAVASNLFQQVRGVTVLIDHSTPAVAQPAGVIDDLYQRLSCV